MDTSKVTRLDVVDHRADGKGLHAYYGITIELDLQDDDRTLKVFVRDGEPFVMDMRGWNDRQS